MPPLRNPILPGSTPTPPSSFTTVTTTSPPQPSNGILDFPSTPPATFPPGPLSSPLPSPVPTISTLTTPIPAVSGPVPLLHLHLHLREILIPYTDKKHVDSSSSRSSKDTHNYIISSPSITGPWSSPLHINSSAFNPSLFHDEENGKVYVVNMLQGGDHRKRPIVCQEWDFEKGGLVGEGRNVFFFSRGRSWE